jgi:hypothetical protein
MRLSQARSGARSGASAHAGDAGVQNPVKPESKQIKDMACINFLYMGLFRRIEISGVAG